ncbi:MAG: lysozyme inhibitor LprI family protein [Cyanobacteria bacterium P01_A01_bin.105]
MGKPSYKAINLFSLGLLLGLLASCGQSDQVASSTDTEATGAAETTAETSAPTDASEPSQPSESVTEAPRSSPVALAKQDCGQLATQLDMNQCAAENYSISDKALNRVYQEVRQGLGEAATARLTTAEERWIVFREAHCNFESDRFEGGSIAPLIQASCMEQITDNRIAELQQTDQTEASLADVDGQLNEVYQAVQALASDEQGEALTDVQLIWLDYRDAHCEFEANLSAAANVTDCLASVTETRVWQLDALRDEWAL